MESTAASKQCPGLLSSFFLNIFRSGCWVHYGGYVSFLPPPCLLDRRSFFPFLFSVFLLFARIEEAVCSPFFFFHMAGIGLLPPPSRQFPLRRAFEFEFKHCPFFSFRALKVPESPERFVPPPPSYQVIDRGIPLFFFGNYGFLFPLFLFLNTSHRRDDT